MANTAVDALPPASPLLNVQGLAAAYRGLRALHGVDLTVAACEIVAVVGANGASKSTLLRAISGQMQITGSITFDGTPIARLPAHGSAAFQLKPRAKMSK